jgi:hypothetical protein
MPVNFRQRAAALQAQLAQVEADLENASDVQKRRLVALKASLQRSLRWYTARAGSRSDIHALRVSVAEDISTRADFA